MWVCGCVCYDAPCVYVHAPMGRGGGAQTQTDGGKVIVFHCLVSDELLQTVADQRGEGGVGWGEPQELEK